MRVNGWHRLWLVSVFAWLCVIVLFTAPAIVNAPSGSESDLLRTAALFWFITSLASLVVGYGVAWAIRGFQGRPTE